MTRRRSSKSKSGPGPFSNDHGPISPLLPAADSQLWSEPTEPSYTYVSSSPGRQPRRPGQQTQYLDVQDFSPLEYCDQMPKHDFSPTPILGSGASPGEFESSNLSRMGLPKDYDPLYSPHTPTSDTLTFASTAVTGSEPMSRDATSDILCDSTLMLRLNSTTSYDFNTVDSQSVTLSPSDHFSFGSDVIPSYAHDVSKSRSYSVDFPLSTSVEEVSPSNNSPISSKSVTQSRAVKRTHDQFALGRARPLRPKVEREGSSNSDTKGAKMVKVPSADGKTKEVVQIPKAVYTRPARQKAFCHYCTDQSEGFHGDHELRRHIDRVHSVVRKVWVCKDISLDKKFLSKCKACRLGKTYGANYNAAAHLRRTHFFPCKKGRGGRGKGNEKRGGKGGGDQPPMDVLKHWMFQKDEIVLDHASQNINKSLAADQNMHQISVGDDFAEVALDHVEGFDDNEFALDNDSTAYFDDNLGQGMMHPSEACEYEVPAQFAASASHDLSTIDSCFDPSLALPFQQQYSQLF